MTPYTDILAHLLAALVAGGMIGYERSYHGRPAGFRTHTLVCLASGLLMVAAVYQHVWFVHANPESLRIDPTRMAQGIMTGIGFLGAGVIVKEGFSVRGLTTAASIWITAAIGILAGTGMYFATAVGVLLTLGTLAGFRWIEARMARRFFAQLTICLAREAASAWEPVRALIVSHGFSIANVGYRLEDEGRTLRFQMAVRAAESASARRLAETLLATPAVRSFDIVPTVD